ncbi:MAG TPA: type II toxin-antitoxin system VapC family toxin [Gammaproteobacteria bacterium]|jgi:tRNA(fMet)-specific endonuclease VapC
MAARFLLDSDICVYALSGRHPEVVRTLDRKLPGQVAVSVIALGELLAGAERSSDPGAAQRRIAALTSVATVLPLPPEAASHYGTIRAGLEDAGRPIGPNDLWIAAHARAGQLILVTNNQREFKRVKGLRVENWAA